MRFLILNQDKVFSKFIINHFSNSAILDLTSNENDFLDKFYLYDYDLVLLNYNSSETNLLDLIKEIKEEKQYLPIICLSDLKLTSILNQLMLLQINYLFLKPNWSELEKPLISLGALTFDPKKDSFFINKLSLKLRKKEHLLLKFLFLNQDQFFSKEQLSHKVIKDLYSRGSNLIDVYIYRLRKLLSKEFSGVKIINQRNYGYKITACSIF